MKVYRIICLIVIIILLSFRISIMPVKSVVLQEGEVYETEYRFIPIQKWKTNAIVYDKETGVQYFVMDGAMTVIVDVNGKPLLYKGEK